LVISAGLGISLAIYIMRHKGITGVRLVGMILLLAAWYALTYAFELVSLSIEARLFWIKAEYVSIVSFLPVLLIFSLRFSGLTRYLKVPLYLVLLVEPAITLAMIWTTPAHTWYYQSYSLVISGAHFQWSVVYGPAFWAHTLYSALLFAVCMVIFIRKMFYSNRAQRRQAGIVLLGICLTGLGTLLYTARIGSPGYDQTPLLGLLSGGIIAWFVVRSRFFEFSPIALEAVLHSMGDGVILLDLRNRILRLNPAAEQILGWKTVQAELQPLEMALPEMAGKFTALAPGNDASLEMELGTEAARRVYVVSVSVVREGRGSIAGRLLLLHDITERKETQDRLHEARTQLAQRVHELELRTRQITLLTELSSGLQACQRSEDAYRLIGQFAGLLFSQTSGYLMILAPDGNQLLPRAGWGEPLPEPQPYPVEDCWALCNGQIHLARTTSPTRLCRHIRDPRLAGSLCVPVLAEGEVIGVVNLLVFGDHFEVVETQIHLAMAMAEQIGLALSNLQLRDHLRQQAIHDPLTGLYNRYHLPEALETAQAQTTQAHTPLSVIMLDLDHFKAMNTRYGHLNVDLLLVEFGKLVRDFLSNGEVALRYGGDEFVLILPGTTLDQAAARARQLQDRVRQLVVPLDDQRSIRNLTLSIGIAGWPRHGSTFSALLQSADTALFRAKEKRDDVVIAL
jgi:diguanylate cyclase (GGDEF)-like protein/PAS domain S-box-containing protein